MRHSLRIALFSLAAVCPCKAFLDHGPPESAKSPESWEHVFQSHPLSPSNPPPAHSFNSLQSGSVENLHSDHPNFNLPPAGPSFHPGTDYAPNFQLHPHQDRGEPEAFAVSEAPRPLEDSSGQQAHMAHPDREKPHSQESLPDSSIFLAPISHNVEAWLAHLLTLPIASLDFGSLDDHPNHLTAPATDHTPVKSPVPDTSSRLPQPSGTFEPSTSPPALGAFEHFPSHHNEHSRADWRLYNAATPSLAEVSSQLNWDYVQRVSEHSYEQGTFDNLACDPHTVRYPVLRYPESTINSDKQHFQSHPLASSFIPAPETFDEPARLNTVAWEGPHQSYQTEPHNFAAYSNSVWSSHMPSHLTLHPVDTEPVRDSEPWALVYSSGQEASHNADQHSTSRVPTAPESTSNSNHQLSRSSDGVTALNSRTRRRKSPEPPVQLSAPLPSDPHSHGLPIKSFTKTYFENPDAKLVITFHKYSDDQLLLFDEEKFRKLFSRSPVKSKWHKVAGVKPPQQRDSLDAFLPNDKAWLAYWHSRTKVDPRDYLQRVTWGEAVPIFPLFLIYVELITAFLRKPNPRGYAEEFRQRCELFVKEANSMKQVTPSSTSSVQALGPTNPMSTKKMMTPKNPTRLGNRPLRYVNVVWKLIFCWARDYRPTLLTTNNADELIIPKALKTFINSVFVASVDKLTQSTCQLVGLPYQHQLSKRRKH
ncbi:hypothetical protein VP01_2874g3 [Puccinia sorghi]|uniref:Uncharacterized protein n=1 Tax=Puccinia sorghi TaxID=27349 RepID=A0A0L6V1U2_9BASI|nr:hypothetical protein VP01_2874g3 [Puccinia sorghi]